MVNLKALSGNKPKWRPILIINNKSPWHYLGSSSPKKIWQHLMPNMRPIYQSIIPVNSWQSNEIATTGPSEIGRSSCHAFWYGKDSTLVVSNSIYILTLNMQFGKWTIYGIINHKINSLMNGITSVFMKDSQGSLSVLPSIEDIARRWQKWGWGAILHHSWNLTLLSRTIHKSCHLLDFDTEIQMD